MRTGTRSPTPSIVHQTLDWTLAVVRQTGPSSGGEVLWEKELRVYRYHAAQRQLTFQNYPEIKWPDGSLRLTGQEPLHFQKDELAALPTGGEKVMVNLIAGLAWPGCAGTWEFDFLPPDSVKVHYLLSLVGDLD